MNKHASTMRWSGHYVHRAEHPPIYRMFSVFLEPRNMPFDLLLPSTALRRSPNTFQNLMTDADRHAHTGELDACMGSRTEQHKLLALQ